MKYRGEGCSPEKPSMDRAEGFTKSEGHDTADEKASLSHSPGIPGLIELDNANVR
jgi:hypothetical protein